MRIFWTENEIKIMRQKYSTNSRQNLLMLLPNRTWESISKEAQKLGIWKKNVVWDYDKKPFRVELTEAEKGYIAGLIDGEGTIGFVHSKLENRIVPCFRIANTSEKLMRWLKKKITIGHIYTQVREFSKQRTNATCYSFNIQRISHIEKMLELLMPYLQIKKDNAKIMLRFCKIKKNKKRFLNRHEKGRICGWKKSLLTKEDWLLFNRMKKLNIKPNKKIEVKTEIKCEAV